MNFRRRLVFGAGAGLICAPFAAFSQHPAKIWSVGFLLSTARPSSIENERYGVFSKGMRELGYIEAKNLVIHWRFADNSNERMAALARELVQLKVDVIVTAGVPPTSVAQKATTTIPIVMATSTDPIGSGLVKSLARPGGNITGLSNIAVDIGPKHLEMLALMVPKLSRVAVLLNPDTSSHSAIFQGIDVVARKMKVTTIPLQAQTSQEIEQAFTVMVRENATGLVVPLAPLFNQQRRQIAQLALKHRLPSISGIWEYAELGGLMAYGQNLADHFFRAATYVDKIFKGAKPGDLPIEQPTRFESVINRQTAKALGLTIPEALVLQADKVIE